MKDALQHHCRLAGLPALTRRQALTLGAATGLAALVGRAAPARAASNEAGAGAGGGAEAHLRRASYLPLVGQPFTVAGAALVLRAVGDLDHLAGRDDAFRLQFAGAPGVVDAGIVPFRHRALGAYELFVTPVGALEDGTQHYEAVIDRSVPLPQQPGSPDAAAPAEPAVPGRREPAAPSPSTSSAGAGATPAPTSTAATPRRRATKATRLAKAARRRRRRAARRAAARAKRLKAAARKAARAKLRGRRPRSR